jgi:hypothetical protein
MGKVNLAKREHQIGQRSPSGCTVQYCIYKGFGELVVTLSAHQVLLGFKAIIYCSYSSVKISILFSITCSEIYTMPLKI